MEIELAKQLSSTLGGDLIFNQDCKMWTLWMNGSKIHLSEHAIQEMSDQQFWASLIYFEEVSLLIKEDLEKVYGKARLH